MPRRPKGKHLSLADRRVIEQLLKEGHSIRYIAEQMDCSPSTVSRELSGHAEKKIPKTCDCINFRNCTLKDVCHPGRECKGMCRNCPTAKRKCQDYVRAYCNDAIANRTGVCNFCRKRSSCHYTRYMYDADKAQAQADEALVSSRKGRNISEEHLAKIDRIMTPLLKQGQSIYHIMQTHSRELGVSESTMRRLVNGRDITACNLDLRSTVQRKLRHKNTDNSYKNMKVIKDGHKYEDYLAYMEENDVSPVQMDCVEGKKEDLAVLLTLHFPASHLQLALILNEHTAAEVVHALDVIETQLGPELFAECFPVILTDNGHEFADIEGMESSIAGGKRTKVFFCEPNRSDEKGAAENNHKYIRYVIPKGTTLEPYRQYHISLVMDHVNSLKRKSLGGLSPYEVARMMLPEDFFILLNLNEIPADEVNLTPSLLR